MQGCTDTEGLEPVHVDAQLPDYVVEGEQRYRMHRLAPLLCARHRAELKAGHEQRISVGFSMRVGR